MAVSPLDPQSVRLSIASDAANTLFLHFMVAFIQQLDISSVNGQRKRVEKYYNILPLNSGIIGSPLQ